MTQATDLNQLSTEQLRERHKQLENQLVQMRADIERLNTELLQQRETYLNIQSQILGESVKIYSISPPNSGEM
jgi:predicted  nucleic acid-binding Zn-ribbon protein